jgi:putative glutamine amidotransferase
LLTGGDDINPDLYEKSLPKKIRRTVVETPDNGQRDAREIHLIAEIFRQRKPLLAICRGHQMLNVAFGGKLIADISRQIPKALNHEQSAHATKIVHEAALTAGSLVSKICKTRILGVNSTHHQAVMEPAKPFVATGQSRDGIVEVMELKPAWSKRMPFLLSMQFHPERLAETGEAYRNIFKTFVAACGKPLKK